MVCSVQISKNGPNYIASVGIWIVAVWTRLGSFACLCMSVPTATLCKLFSASFGTRKWYIWYTLLQSGRHPRASRTCSHFRVITKSMLFDRNVWLVLCFVVVEKIVAVVFQIAFNVNLKSQHRCHSQLYLTSEH